jgi:Carboxypeptidase regulatory-like domain
MAIQDNLLERMRIASPCPMSWEKMSGDGEVRFCDQCQLHVYNISEMTRERVEELLTIKEGRICARLYRRADGTVLTKDCPVGLRALRRHVGRVASATLTTLLSLAAGVLGQTLARTGKHESTAGQKLHSTNLLSLNPQEGRALLWGVITDPQGTPIAGARVTILSEKSKYKRTIKSDSKGQFKFGLLEPGLYTLKVESAFFQSFERAHFNLHSSDELRYDVSLNIGGLIGVVVLEELPTKGIDIDGVHVKINER